MRYRTHLHGDGDGGQTGAKSSLMRVSLWVYIVKETCMRFQNQTRIETDSAGNPHAVCANVSTSDSTPEMTTAKACGALFGAALKLHPSVLHVRNLQLQYWPLFASSSHMPAFGFQYLSGVGPV